MRHVKAPCKKRTVSVSKASLTPIPSVRFSDKQDKTATSGGKTHRQKQQSAHLQPPICPKQAWH
jgi:hypothetical protein